MTEKTPAQLVLDKAQEMLEAIRSDDGPMLMATKAMMIVEVIDENGDQTTLQVASDTPYWNLIGLLHMASISVQSKLADDIREVGPGDISY